MSIGKGFSATFGGCCGVVAFVIFGIIAAIFVLGLLASFGGA